MIYQRVKYDDSTVGTAAVGMAASEALESDTSDNLVNMLSAVLALKDNQPQNQSPIKEDPQADDSNP